MILGILLAAGESRRMGSPKQLLPWGDTIVLQRIIDVAAASRLERLELILGHRAGEIAGRIRLPEKVQSFVNEDYRTGMASSIKCGIRNAPDGAEAFMLLLGDQPLVEPWLIDQLLEAYRVSTPAIVIPLFEGRRGHPVIFAARLREELLAVGDQGAREVLHRHAAEVCEVAVNSVHVLVDMDTPRDYQEAISRGVTHAGQEIQQSQ
jgi:molybdenum cofactor cytidylyltransferase